jgi:hypothetical protein
MAALADSLGIFIGFILTLLVMSYIIGDNALLRLVLHIFIGVASGYAVVMVFYNVIWNQVILSLILDPLGNLSLTVPSLLLGIWLLTKMSPRLTRMGNPVMAYLVGVGAATIIGGAVLGTVFPQISASINLFDFRTVLETNTSIVSWFFNGVIILFGTVATLSYFHFGVKPSSDGVGIPHRHPLLEGVLAPVGQVFIAITFGALFAGVLSASLAALVDRVQYLWSFIVQFLP